MEASRGTRLQPACRSHGNARLSPCLWFGDGSLLSVCGRSGEIRDRRSNPRNSGLLLMTSRVSGGTPGVRGLFRLSRIVQTRRDTNVCHLSRPGQIGLADEYSLQWLAPRTSEQRDWVSFKSLYPERPSDQLKGRAFLVGAPDTALRLCRQFRNPRPPRGRLEPHAYSVLDSVWVFFCFQGGRTGPSLAPIDLSVIR